MNPSPLEALNLACAFFGTQAGLAARLGIDTATISCWRTTGRVPDQHCLPIEDFTEGQIKAEWLRPDLEWMQDDAGNTIGHLVRPSKRKKKLLAVRPRPGLRVKKPVARRRGKAK